MSAQNKGGRKKITNPRIHRYSIKLNDTENEKFLKMFDECGLRVKAYFITSRIFNEPFKVIKIDKGAIDYISKLSTFYFQFRSIGVNYNQIVATLKTNFSERKALAMIYKLEKTTIELIKVNREIIELTKKFEQDYLQRSKD